jgi:hypothetical protein
MATKILLRRDNTTNWNTENPILDSGELGVEIITDNEYKIKIGNGINKWTQLEYFISGDKNHKHSIEDILNLPAVPQPATTTPKVDGTANVGTDNKYARADHVHPSDTTKLNLSGGTLTGALTAGGTLAIDTAQARNILASTSNLTAGSSKLATGQIYLVYE